MIHEEGVTVEITPSRSCVRVIFPFRILKQRTHGVKAGSLRYSAPTATPNV